MVYALSMRFILTAIFVCLLPMTGSATFSNLDCDDSARLMETLTQVLGAKRQGIGLRDPDTMIEIWVQDGNNDWFIVQSYANGTSCIVAMGEFWEGALNGPA